MDERNNTFQSQIINKLITVKIAKITITEQQLISNSHIATHKSDIS